MRSTDYNSNGVSEVTISTNTDSEICGLKKQVKRQRRHVQEGPNSSSCELCIRRNSERGKSRPAVSADDRRLRPIRIVQVGHGGPAAAAAVARRGVFLGSQFSQSLVSQFSRPLVCAVDGLGSQCVPPSLRRTAAVTSSQPPPSSVLLLVLSRAPPLQQRNHSV